MQRVFFPSAKPKFQAGPSVLTALIGQTVTLPCVVQGEPRPQVSWFHDGRLLETRDVAALRIQRASLADRGSYSCVAENSAGQDTLLIQLEVLGESTEPTII